MNEKEISLRTIFVEAVEITDAAERAAYLQRICGDDATLRQRVERLLKAHDAEGGFASTEGATAGISSVTERPGDRIGRYKLREQIGEGGCGVVYVAEQEEPVRRRVALKVIKLGMDTRQVIARFEAERQALAMMDHPNIAKVLDGGATETGRHYIVMELVRGIKITDYCDQHNLATEERLKLVIQVCSAIQHAHQKGIIHRDIKPSNILVTLHDGVPVPKVIDFGIAKATADQRLTDKTIYTAFEQFIGTPAYMSPEQAEMSGLDIDTRSDIYSLGVLLYELLTGRTPFDAKALLQAGLDEMRRIIREQEPVKPSTRLSTLADADLTEVARHQQSEAPRLIHVIRGDLDWIVMKALEKDRARRYETANGLALDLQRHLNNEPVVACPPTATYRIRKLVARNKLAFTAASAVVLSLLAGLAISTVSLFREKAARERAVAAEQAQIQLRQQAEAETTKSLRFAQFVQELLNRLGLDLMDERLVDQSKLAEAEVIVNEALAIRRKQLGNEDPGVAMSLNTLTLVLQSQGKLAQAETAVREALAIWRKRFGTEHLNVTFSLGCLGGILHKQGRLPEAEAAVREALAIRKEHLGSEHHQVADDLQFLSELLQEQSKLGEAEIVIREAIAIRRKSPGNKPGDLGRMIGRLATILRGSRKWAEAETLSREALEMQRKSFGNEHRDVDDALVNLARVLRAQGKLEEAEAVSREELALEKRLSGKEHPFVANSLAELAPLLAEQGKFIEAESVIREALAIRRKFTGDASRDVAMTLSLLADVFESQEKVQEAEQTLRHQLTIERKLAGNDDPALATALAGLARVLLQNEKFAEAELHARESMAIREKKFPDDWRTFNARAMLGRALLGQKKHAEAEPLLLSGYEGMKQREDKIPVAGKPRLKETIQRVIQLYEATNRPDQASEWKLKLAEFDKAGPPLPQP